MLQENNQNKSIFVIDDDRIIRESCLKILQKAKFEIEVYEDGEKGLQRLKEHQPDLLIVDLKMPKVCGMEVINDVQKIDPNIVIIVITGYATVGTAVEAMKAGAYDFLPKPFTPDELRLIVHRGLERRQLMQQAEFLKAEKKRMEHRCISFVSHQLKAPLAAVQQYLETLKYLGNSQTAQACMSGWIDRSLHRIREMESLVGDWLTISKIESGHFIESITSVALPRLIAEIIENFQSDANKRDIRIVSRLPENLSPVNSCIKCLQVIFSNVISNAIKYNIPNGSVEISADETESSIFIYVRDTGIGIPEDQLPLIFQEFHRVQDPSTKSIPGTGLGLPICQKIIKELGGDIQLTSEYNNGTTVEIRLEKK